MIIGGLNPIILIKKTKSEYDFPCIPIPIKNVQQKIKKKHIFLQKPFKSEYKFNKLSKRKKKAKISIIKKKK